MCEEKKSGCFGRLVKVVLAFVVLSVVVVAAFVLALPLWINPVATTVAEAVVPCLTGTAFRMDAFRLNPYTGSLRIEEVHLANPPGYSAKECFSVSTVDVQVAVRPLLRHFLHVERVNVVGAYASYQSHGGTNNVDAILAHVNGVLGLDAEGSGDVKPSAPETAEAGGEPFRIRIESLDVSGTRLQVSELPVTLPVPPLSLSGIGASENGSSFSEVSEIVCNKVMEAGGSAFSAAGSAAGALKDGAKGVTDTLGNSAKAVTDTLGDGTKAVTEGAKAVTDGLKDGAKALKSLFK